MKTTAYKGVANVLRGAMTKAAVVVAAMTLALTGCITDETVIGPNNGNGNTGGDGNVESGPVTFTFAVPGAEVVRTRAATTAENAIRGDKLWVLMVDRSTGTLTKKVEATVKNLTDATAPGAPATASAEMVVDYDGKSYDLLLVANLDRNRETQYAVDENIGDIAVDATREEIREALIIRRSEPWNTNLDKGNGNLITCSSSNTDPYLKQVYIPMSGELTNVTINKVGRDITDPVVMTRMLARVDVKVGAALRDRFKLEQAGMGNRNHTGYLITAAGDSSIPTDQTTETAPVGFHPFASDDTDGDGHGDAVTGKIYVFEQANAAVFPQSGWEQSPCVLVRGSLDGGEASWYRLDFVREKGKTRDIDKITRNYIYEFTITAVEGKGYASAEDARRHPAANLDADVVVWDADDLANVNIDNVYSGLDRYSVEIGTATGGAGRAEYNMPIPAGMTVEVSALPEPGYRFTHWTFSTTDAPLAVGYTAASNPAKIVMPVGGVTATPHFEEARFFDVTLGSVSTEGGGLVCGVTAKLLDKDLNNTAEPNTLTPGTRVQITGTIGSAYNVDDMQYAEFKEWKLTKTASGEDVTASLLPGGALTSATSNPAEFAMPDYQVTATPVLGYRVNVEYDGKLILTYGNGEGDYYDDSRAAMPGGAGVLPGTTVSYTVSVAPNWPEYYFSGWTEYPSVTRTDALRNPNVSGVNKETLTFDMPVGGKTIVAKAEPYRMLTTNAKWNDNGTWTSMPNGSVTLTTSPAPYYANNDPAQPGYRNWTEVTVGATTPAGYKLTGWKINGADYHEGATSTMTFRIQNATNTVTAQYTRWYKITPTAILLNDDETVAEDITAQLLQAGKTFTYNSNTSSNVEVEADNTAWAKHKVNVDVVAPDLTAAPHGYGFVRWHDGTSPVGRGISYYPIRQNQTPTAYYKRLYTASANVSLGGSVQANTNITYHTVSGTTPGAAMTGNSKPEWISGVAAHYAVKAPATVTNTTDGRIYAFEGWTATDSQGNAVTPVPHTNPEGDRLFIFDTSEATGNITLTANYSLPFTASIGVTTHAGQTTPVSVTAAAAGFTVHRGNTASGAARDWATLVPGRYTATAPATLTIGSTTHYFYGWAANADNAAAHTFDITNGNVALEARYTHIPPSSSVKVWTYTYRSGGRDIVVEGTTEWSSTNLAAGGGVFIAAQADPDSPDVFGGYFNWTEAKTACPWGWRLPTAWEVVALVEPTTTWNGTNGNINGTAGVYRGNRNDNSSTDPGELTITIPGYAPLLFPHGGYKSATGNTINNHGQGRYWTSDQNSTSNGYLLFLGPASAYDNGALQNDAKTLRQSVRCVRDAVTP